MSRRKARELAFKVLFQVDQVDTEPQEAFDYLMRESPLAEKDRDFAWSLVEGSVEKIEQIDALLASFSKDWTVQRMSSVDRNLLRVASYEILYLDQTQPVVAIDEALEIAKRYSEPASVGFINAILDKVRAGKI
ncbi:MAG: transcription antitermination factor NusB [Firmicutes bacterium]|nr:transcription antitermination factor NusB [Bacillota bacterium]